jgi:alpha-galactosidase
VKIFGKPLAAGPLRFDDGRFRVEAEIEAIAGGFTIRGTIRGRGGRLEVFRSPVPARFLSNNWQSWGPMQVVTPDFRFPGLAERMADYSRYVFTPIPDVFAATLVSDYFAAWESALIGFLSSRIAHPYFVVEGGELAGYLEYFDVPLEESIPLEPLVVLRDRPAELLLEDYADRTAAENGVRVRVRNPIGWSSWYQYFTELTAADVRKNLRLSSDGGFPFEVFQIDDGYERDIGDWLDVKNGFIALDELAGLIRDQGFTAGLWTAPFSAAESSEVFRRHPDWFVHQAGRPKPCYCNWKKQIYALDTTHPAALAWLAETFSALRRMGYSYFKIDFLFAAAMEGDRFARVTPVQAYRRGLEVIRRAAGGDFVLGCGAPLLPSLGLVDGMRVGEDTAPFWDSGMSGIAGPNAYIALKNPILRSFMHRRWWLNDPDCLLLRRQDVRLTDNEKQLYARVCGALDAMLIESDDLGLVDDWGKAVLREAVGLQGGRPRVQGLLDDDVYIIETEGRPAGSVRLAVNLSDRPRDFPGRTVPARSAEFLSRPDPSNDFNVFPRRA